MICLIGESGSGKSLVERQICSRHGLERVISYTTRPPREGEIDGVDYHFVSEEKFLEMEANEEFAETTIFREWHYGAALKDIRDKDVFVIEPVGLKKLVERSKELDLDLVIVYIKVPERQRMIRMLERGDDVDEVIRRIHNDRETFKDVEKLIHHVIYNTSHIDYAVSNVLRIHRVQY